MTLFGLVKPKRKGRGMSDQDHKPAGRVVHPSGTYAVSYCSCGSVTIQVGEMNFRLTEESFYEFARTVGVGFEKISGEPSRILGEMELGMAQGSVVPTAKKPDGRRSGDEPDFLH